MKLRILTAALLSIAAIVATAAETESFRYSTARAKGEDFSDPAGKLYTHAIPADFPSTHQGLSSKYNVAVDSHLVGMYTDRVTGVGGYVAFGMFEFEEGKEVEIEIASKEEIKSFDLLPKSLAEYTSEPELTMRGERSYGLKFKIKKADQKFTLVINGKYRGGNVLHLFANSIDKTDPKIEVPEGKDYVWDKDSQTYYLRKGYISKANSGFSVSSLSGRKLYIPAGTILDGEMKMGSNAKIYGRGMLMNITKNMILSMSWGGNSSVEGITIYGHNRSQAWTTGVDNFSNAAWKNVNIIATGYASTDGIDLNYATDCTFDNCFIRTNDDNIAIKALNMDNRQGPTQNLTFTRMQLWNDCNNAFGLGAETNATIYQNIKLLDSEVLYSYDDPSNHEKLDERSAMNICCLQGTYFKDILFENIYVNRCQRLIGLGFKADFWFGSIQGDQTTPGGISGVMFRNVTCPNKEDSSIANEIHLYGWKEDGTPDKWVEDITFDNVVIEGKLLASEDDPHFVKNEMVRDLKFLNSGVESGIADSHKFAVRQNGSNLEIIGADGDADWVIYSLGGQLVAQGSGTRISVAGLQPSLYLVRVVDGGSVATMKVHVK